jgi:hypothetical protein
MTSQPSCEQLYRKIDDDNFVLKITKWADQEILHRKFANENYIIGKFSGPGLRTSTLDAERAGIDVPTWLGKHEIRVIDGRDNTVRVIFIGVGRYRGFLIGEHDISNYSDNKRINLSKIKSKGRVGVVCYEEKDL